MNDQREDGWIPVIGSARGGRQTLVDHADVGGHACRHVAVDIRLDLDHHHYLAAIPKSGQPKDIAEAPVAGAADELRRHRAKSAEVDLANPSTGNVRAKQILDESPVAKQSLADLVLGLRGIHTQTIGCGRC